MRGLILKNHRFYSEDTEKSNWPPAIKGKQDFDKARKNFENIITIWICVENKDKKEYIDDLVVRVNDLNKQFYNLDDVVVLPFGHLSHDLANPNLAIKLIDDLVFKLKNTGFKNVNKMSFGTHKLIGFDVAGHRGAVSYFEFPYSGQKPQVK